LSRVGRYDQALTSSRRDCFPTRLALPRGNENVNYTAVHLFCSFSVAARVSAVITRRRSRKSATEDGSWFQSNY